VRGNYFVEHWWEVVKDALFEILVPGVAIYRHLPKAWDDLMLAWDEWKVGHKSRAIDSILDAAREIMAIFSTFIAQVSIAAFIIGSILGTPIVGVAALAAIGLTVIAIDVSLQAATIAKAIYNLNGGDDDDDDNRLEKDYGRIADSSIAIVIMLVLVLLGAVASKAASALIKRFPALGRAAESLKVKIRQRLRIKPKVPTKITSKMKPIEAMPPDAVGYDAVRSKLSPEYQKALDKFIAERPPNQVKAALDSKKDALGNTDIAKVEAMLKNQVQWVRDQQGIRADNARWEGEMLDPNMKNGPVQQGGKDVWARWTDKPPAEVPQAERLNAKTGERVEVFGDDYPGIDGTIGHPPRPLQLKSVPATEPIPEIPRVAGDALDKANANGFSRIEVSIEAPGRTVKQVQEAFEASKRAFTDSKGVARVRVWCDDGVFEPTSFTPRIAPHPGPDVKDPDKQKVPAGVGGGG
jgi:multisubunit Na+/H+ antiporter MnhB subunit